MSHKCLRVQSVFLWAVLRRNLFTSTLYGCPPSPALLDAEARLVMDVLWVGLDVLQFMAKYPADADCQRYVSFMHGHKLQKCALVLRLLATRVIGRLDASHLRTFTVALDKLRRGRKLLLDLQNVAVAEFLTVADHIAAGLG